MTTIHPFNAYLVAPNRADEVVAPIYDSMNAKERASFASAHPNNYVNVMRVWDEYTAQDHKDLDQLLASNAHHLNRLLEDQAFQERGEGCLFVYKLAIGEHEQVGLVAEVPIEEYDEGRIRRHEDTRSDREDQLVRYQEVVGASSGPVCLTYQADPEIDTMIAVVTGSAPVIDFVNSDGVEQVVWAVTDADLQARFVAAFEQVGVTYLTDGHHRAASGSRYAARMRKIDPDDRDAAWNYLLVALFPDNQLRILPFNRCVKDLGGISQDEFLTKLEESFAVEPLQAAFESAPAPATRGEFIMVLDRQFFRLRVKPDLVPTDPALALDVSVLQNLILTPVLGIDDPRADPRLDYVSGDTGFVGIEKRCSEDWRLAFICHPTSIEELMAVADAGEVMPPKSTCFDPKAHSGIFLRLR